MKYKWGNQSFKNADVNKVGKELELIGEDKIDNKKVLEYARKNKNSELHKCFEWDDKIASEKYRLIQAAYIITSISVIIDEKENQIIKKYVNIKISEGEKQECKSIFSIIQNSNDYQALIEKYKKEIMQCNEKYEKLIKLNDRKDVILSLYEEMK